MLSREGANNLKKANERTEGKHELDKPCKPKEPKMKEFTDGVVLMYMQGGIIYPVALSEEENNIIQMTASLISPLTVVFDQPQGKAVNLTSRFKK